ncbi:predicted protein [Scheffersomyces stipitis CBS 6054]|uniref:Uncharacterized protein n=1 Tax=Scheffersomyces stipitis (strain ATCC 58785 / CBS 6054 / NBRC 10063 / NRRL Y-11545) TaxID=322104 RepID=A3LS35_PICST|nr:predicted protein [Scheffersomyces stipitis CBS 6054]ABN65493.2 predicted protein [Scheffersomyces stipitis CBS 6054]
MSTLGKIDELVSWSKSNGALVSQNVSFRQISPGNIGAFYGSSHGEDAKLEGYQMRLPVKLVVTLCDAIESFQKDSEGDFKEISRQTSSINSLLKLYLARERSSKYLTSSFYKPYLQLLPTLKDINSPYCWTADDKDLLKGTNLGNSLKENIGQLVEEWWQVINLLPESVEKPDAHFVNMKFYYEFKFYKDEDLYNYFVVQNENDADNWTSFPNYLWASLILKSRSFPAYLLKSAVDADFKRDEAMLLPLVDLLNHDSKANVSWSVDDKCFNFKSDSVVPNAQLYNNYGLKGNEELLLAYGFCIEDNASDSVALKIKIPQHLMSELQKNNIKLPTIEDYTTSVVRSDNEKKAKGDEYEDGVLFFITNDNLPENLLEVFQFLVKNKWENNGITLRMKLAGLNQLRQALESKNNLLNTDIVSKSNNAATIKTYIQSQRKIYLANIKKIKRLEKELLSDSENKPHLVTLKNVFKKDHKFQQSLLVSLGVSSYDEIVNSQFSDQAWLLYLIRCYNRDEYVNPNESDSLGDDDNYLPKWIKDAFLRVEKEEGEPSAAEVVQYKDLYLGLIPQLAEIVPEIYNRGKWRVQELIRSAKLLDTISFVRGKEQECILVETE